MKSRVDPIEIFEDYELELVLRRNNIAFPSKCSKEPSSYTQELIDVSLIYLVIFNHSCLSRFQIIKEKCPLDGTDPLHED